MVTYDNWEHYDKLEDTVTLVNDLCIAQVNNVSPNVYTWVKFHVLYRDHCMNVMHNKYMYRHEFNRPVH